MVSMRGRVPSSVTVCVIVAACVVFGVVGFIRFERPLPGPGASSEVNRMRIPLWVTPESVIHDPAPRFAFDPPSVLQELRKWERLDSVVAGASTPEEVVRRLMHWTREQFEPGRPDPYPPPDALVILRDVRAGRTGGFCAHYCFVLLQACGSFGIPVRMATVRGHEVAEAWLEDEQRWTLVDPMYALQVVDERGRSLSALEIRDARQDPDRLTLTSGHRYPEDVGHYARRFDVLAVWIRNDFISRPVNFADFPRCRVWIAPPPDATAANAPYRTDDPGKLYDPPSVRSPLDGVVTVSRF